MHPTSRADWSHFIRMSIQGQQQHRVQSATFPLAEISKPTLLKHQTYEKNSKEQLTPIPKHPMNRRKFLKSFSRNLAAILLATPFCCALRRNSRPNVVLIVVDDLIGSSGRTELYHCLY